jgi:4-hydroxythreonine-4-phosphate dehydrogenase
MTAVCPLAVTMGEPSGIGGELTLKAWRNHSGVGLPPYFAIDNVDRLNEINKRLKWGIPIREIANPAEVSDVFAHALPVLPLPMDGGAMPGQPQPENSRAVVASIERAVALVQSGDAAAVVTNPIQKKALYDSGFSFPGHTEFLASLAGSDAVPVMMLACEELRVVPVTVHQSLITAVTSLRQETIVDTTKETVRSLVRDFGIDRPHVMIAALNPHAGEEGTMGREEIEIIQPAVKTLKREGYSVTGPAPADTLFHDRARSAYDAVMCMYHDQALIPLKTIDFRSGVNVTLGLPFVRTSPDHGTALEIAGTGVADEASFVAALRMAALMVENRHRNETVSHDQLSRRVN